jgi:hypothetical protein
MADPDPIARGGYWCLDSVGELPYIGLNNEMNVSVEKIDTYTGVGRIPILGFHINISIRNVLG